MLVGVQAAQKAAEQHAREGRAHERARVMRAQRRTSGACGQRSCGLRACLVMFHVLVFHGRGADVCFPCFCGVCVVFRGVRVMAVSCQPTWSRICRSWYDVVRLLILFR